MESCYEVGSWLPTPVTGGTDVVTVSRYDSQGRLVGYSTISFGAPRTRNRPGCLAAVVGFAFFGFLVLWPVGFIGRSAAGTVLGVAWLTMWAAIIVFGAVRGRRGTRNAPASRTPVQLIGAHEREPARYDPRGRPTVDLRASATAPRRR